ncbi:MAG TPA: hypothetical protein VEU62_03380, partial [Bryobacterales bacterium]|nr:hypothetical protein [Bryobacterales bacterium]
LWHVLDPPRRQCDYRVALLPSQRPLGGLLGIALTHRLIIHVYVAHPYSSGDYEDGTEACTLVCSPICNYKQCDNP